MTSEHKSAAQVFKAFSDENRLRILELLRGGEKCACKLLDDLRITQPTLSHHMNSCAMQVWLRAEKRGNGSITPLILMVPNG